MNLYSSVISRQITEKKIVNSKRKYVTHQLVGVRQDYYPTVRAN